MAARSNRIKKLSTAHKRCGKRKADMVDSKLKPSVQITIADLPSDNDSVLELLHEDPFMPSPQKNAPDKNVRMESSILEDNVKVEVQSSASVGNTKAVAIKQMDDSTFVESVLQEMEDVKWQNNAIVDDYPAFGHYGSQAEAIVEDSAAFKHYVLQTEVLDVKPSEVVHGKMKSLKKPSLSLQTRKRGGATAKKSNSRKVLSASLLDEEDVNSEYDSFVGKTVAFGRNTPICSYLISQFGDKFVVKGVCYDLDFASGHIVGTVLRRNKATRRKKPESINYNVVWGFTAFGDSDLADTVIVDGIKEGCNLVSKREMNRISNRKCRRRKGEDNKIKLIKNNLKQMSDDEAMHVSMFITLLVKNLVNNLLINHAVYCHPLNNATLSRHQVVMNLMGQMMMILRNGPLVKI
jgi:hypothetical protein